MKKNKLLRSAALGLAIISLLLLTACNSNQPKENATGDVGNANGTVFDASTEISIAMPSHASYPYNENMPVWKYIREAVGAKLNITAIPFVEFATKVTLMMTDKSSMPDLLWVDNKQIVDGYAATGALIAVDDRLDNMPNYTKFWSSIPEKEREDLLLRRKSADGKTYFPQVYGTDSIQDVRAWLYRKDIFEKHNIKVPEAMDEVYEVAVELKKLYPDSYPFCLRDGFRNLRVMGAQWKPNFTLEIYYDFASGTWHYGAREDTMRDMVEYMRKMYAEGLVPPDYLSINGKPWEELISTDRGFFMPDYAVRVDFFNKPNRENNPNYTLAAMKPPRANSPTAQNLVNKYNVNPLGYVICNTGNEKRINNAIKLVDWMYSDEAAQLLSWGKEGETYQIKDGEKTYIYPEDGNLSTKYGLITFGTYLRVDPEAAAKNSAPEQAAAINLALKYTEKDYNPVNWLALSDSDIKKRDSLADGIYSYTEEMLSKFLYNQISMSEWDSFVKQLNEMGVDDLLSLYNNAYLKIK